VWSSTAPLAKFTACAARTLRDRLILQGRQYGDVDRLVPVRAGLISLIIAAIRWHKNSTSPQEIAKNDYSNIHTETNMSPGFVRTEMAPPGTPESSTASTTSFTSGKC